MLPSLHIKNYRILRDLELKDLGRVNLIAGKNNTGKSSVLEAILLYIKQFDIDTIVELLANRDEMIDSGDLSLGYDLSHPVMQSLYSLFTGRTVTSNNEKISVCANGEDIAMRLVGIEFDSTGNPLKKTFSIFDFADKLGELKQYQVGIERSKNGHGYSVGLAILNVLRRNAALTINLDSKNIKLVSTRARNEQFVNGRLWDKIQLTSKEDKLVKALEILSPQIQKLSFRGEENTKEGRQPIVKLKNERNPVPLKSMGDGINRILTIILSLVNAENGYLLIDEFENGLHHSVQEDLWKMIFQLAAELNVQVFATTHSYDCIRAFSKVALDDKNQDGKLIRLDNVKGEIKPTYYSEEELRFATEHNIEVR